ARPYVWYLSLTDRPIPLLGVFSELTPMSEITGQVAIGRFVLQIGDPCGAVVREASRTERVHLRPKPTPVLVRPTLIRRLLDRRVEVAAAVSAVAARLPLL